jgi:pimeloyl-ACP methyl ester carboxylesterase
VPTITNGDATLYFEEFGAGFPILAFATGGLGSSIDNWQLPSSPINALTEFSGPYRVIAMDQRNAGRSYAPIHATDGWQSYASDHIAILDHLGIERCHLLGQCIGGPFIFKLLELYPKRFVSAVVEQTGGRVGPMPATRLAAFDAWAATLEGRPEVSANVLTLFYQNLYSAGFVYSVGRDFISRCETPCLILAGNDSYHPYEISEEVARLLPHSEFVPRWKEGHARTAAIAKIHSFLATQTQGELKKPRV